MPIILVIIIFFVIVFVRAYQNRDTIRIEKNGDEKETSPKKKMPNILRWAFVLFVLQIISTAGVTAEKYLNEGYSISVVPIKSLANSIGANAFLIVGAFLCYKYYKDN